LQHRSGPSYSPISLEIMCANLKSLLLTELSVPLEIRDAR
jgi:hypothetical protein